MARVNYKAKKKKKIQSLIDIIQWFQSYRDTNLNEKQEFDGDSLTKFRSANSDRAQLADKIMIVVLKNYYWNKITIW